jgi:hypothetical protein
MEEIPTWPVVIVDPARVETLNRLVVMVEATRVEAVRVEPEKVDRFRMALPETVLPISELPVILETDKD